MTEADVAELRARWSPEFVKQLLDFHCLYGDHLWDTKEPPKMCRNCGRAVTKLEEVKSGE